MKNNFTLSKFLPFIYILTVLFILFMIFKLIIFFLPFVIAFSVVYITRPIFNFISQKLKLSKKISNFLSIILFYILILTILAVLSFLIVNQSIAFVRMIIYSKDSLISNMVDVINNIIKDNKILGININAVAYVNKFVSYIISKGAIFLNYILSLTKNIPFLLVYIIITVMSTFLIANDLEKVNNFFAKEFPEGWLKKFKLIKENVIFVLFSYLKSQAILITTTFTILLIGLNVINVFVFKIEYVLFLAFLIALIDALPLLGTAPILIPWSIYSFLNEKYNLGIAILVMYLIVFLTRQILEPRILSNKLNLNPLVALLALYIGFKFFGIIGFLLGPVLFIIIKIVFENEIKNGFLKTLLGEE